MLGNLCITYNFGMQQLEYKFVVGNARQPVNPAGKTYNFGMIFRNPQRETSNTQVRSWG